MDSKQQDQNDEIENSIEITNSEDLFEDLGFSKEESLILKVKADLYAQILESVRGKGYTQHQVSRILDIPQPRVSLILTGKIDNVSVESLLLYASKLNTKLRVHFTSDRREVV